MAPAQDVSIIQESRMGAETPFLCPPPDDLHQLIYTSFIQYTILHNTILQVFWPFNIYTSSTYASICPWT